MDAAIELPPPTVKVILHPCWLAQQKAAGKEAVFVSNRSYVHEKAPVAHLSNLRSD